MSYNNAISANDPQAAWQRQLTDNAIYSAGRIDYTKPSDGRTVREHQPKMPVRDAGAMKNLRSPSSGRSLATIV